MSEFHHITKKHLPVKHLKEQNTKNHTVVY